MGLCHRRRRLGGLRAGQPADRGSRRQGAAARGRPARQIDVDRHSRGLHPAAQPQILQLEFRDGGGRGHGRPAHSLPARPHARRFELDQRHALCARPAARLRHLGPARQSRLVLFAGPALLQEVGEFRARRRRQPRQGRPAQRRRHVRHPRAVRRLYRRRGGERLPEEQGLQQRCAGRLRLLPGDDEERQTPVDGARLPRSDPRSPQPQGRDRCAGEQSHPRRQARRRRRLQRARPGARGAGQSRGHRVVWVRAVAGRAGAFRHRSARAAAPPWHRGEARAEGRRRELRRPLRAAHELAGQVAGHAERADPRSQPGEGGRQVLCHRHAAPSR